MNQKHEAFDTAGYDSSVDDPVLRQSDQATSKKKNKRNFKKKDKKDPSYVKHHNLYHPDFRSVKKRKKRDRSAYSNKSLKKRKSKNGLFNNLPKSFVKTLGTPNTNVKNQSSKTPKSRHSTSVWLRKTRKKNKMKRTSSYQKEGFNRRGMIKDRTGGYVGFKSMKYQGNKPKKISKIFDGIIDSSAFNSFTPGANYPHDPDFVMKRGFDLSHKIKKQRDYSAGGTPNSNASFLTYKSRDYSKKKSKEKSKKGVSKLELNSQFLNKMKRKNQKSENFGKTNKIKMNVRKILIDVEDKE